MRMRHKHDDGRTKNKIQKTAYSVLVFFYVSIFFSTPFHDYSDAVVYTRVNNNSRLETRTAADGLPPQSQD